MKINFNSYDLGVGGGNRCIFELAEGLANRGHNVSITHLKQSWKYIWYGTPKVKVTNLNYPSNIVRALNKFYLRKRNYRFDEAYYLQKHIPDCDVNVATWWETTYPTLSSGKGRMFYLVQHYEPWFYPENKTYVVKSTLTYQLPMTKLCVSHWLTEKVNGVFIGNGINLKKFKPLNLEKQYDVMVMPKPNVKWKGNYAPVIESLKHSGLQVLVAEGMSEYELVRAYNLSKTFLYLSDHEGFNYPCLEAMACGTPVVSTDCAEYFQKNKNVLLLRKDYVITNKVESKIKWLLQNRDYADFLSDCGLKTAAALDFNKTLDLFENAIKEGWLHEF